jgi:hypothetical protein
MYIEAMNLYINWLKSEFLEVSRRLDSLQNGCYPIEVRESRLVAKIVKLLDFNFIN